MSSQAPKGVDPRTGVEAVSPVEAALRKRIIADPDFVLNDPELMRALLAPAQSAGRNVVDLRGALIQRLETKLGRLTEAHRDVVAAAWDNMTGMEQIHRAALAALEAESVEAFVSVVARDFAKILEVDQVRFCLSADEPQLASPLLDALSEIESGALTIVALPVETLREIAPPADRGSVRLRTGGGAHPKIWETLAPTIQSEAFVRLDLDVDAHPGLLAFGSQDASRFHPEQGHELLTFLGRVVQHAMRDWLDPGRAAGAR